MKVFVFLVCCIFVAQANVLKSRDFKLWEEFKNKHNKHYGSDSEHEFRFKIFIENLREIYQHNKEFDEGKTTFKMGVNQFTDLLSSEFSDLMLTRSENENRAVGEIVALPKADAPDAVDWRSKGAVTPVKDQGQCGGCWAFAATGCLEGQHFLKEGELVSLSEQNLIDCSKNGNNGCGGGLEYNGWEYVRDNGGIDTEEAYPYEARNGQCRFDDSKVGATCTGVKKLTKGDEEELKNGVATVGPISVGIDADSSFQHYQSGVMVSTRCSKTRLNHSVLVVGYGTEDGQDYWLVKNSWGTSFGEDGYIKMARNHDNMCGIASDMSYPTV